MRRATVVAVSALVLTFASRVPTALATTSDVSLHIAAAPWTGRELPGSIENTVKYRITVTARAGAPVTLRASGVPKDWVASWCTDRVCQPTQTRIVLPANGSAIVELQIVPDLPEHAARHPRVHVEARAATVVSVEIRG